MSIIQKIADKLTSGNKMQYILLGTLGLVIVISLISVISGFTGKKKIKYEPKDMHFFCLETEKEFVLTPDEVIKVAKNKEGGQDELGPMMGPGPGTMGFDMFIESPYTKKKTAVAMRECPNCKKYYVPGHIKAMYNEEALTKKQRQAVCPHCGTNLRKWFKNKQKKKKK